MTTRAAAEVTTILLAEGLRPASAFWMTDPYQPGPPIEFTLYVALPALVLSQIATIPDTIIEHVTVE